MKIQLLSQLFQPLITIPKNAVIKNTVITCKSHRLLTECGLIRPTSNGLFAILPLAQRALDKLTQLLCDHMDRAGASRVSLPALSAASLWEASGRLAGAGQELLRVQDRHSKQYLLAPTHEEAIADLLADTGPLSYKQLPLVLYQISSKYRDEARPKHGLLRAREFVMLDAYGVHSDQDSAATAYRRLGDAFRGVLGALQVHYYRVSANPGDMGGDYSHEWLVPGAAGEGAARACPACRSAPGEGPGENCPGCGGPLQDIPCIEVGHTFNLGTKYSGPLAANYVPSAGGARPLIMTCYGIGITRLLAACVEHLSTEQAIRWPHAIAPYTVLVIGPKEGSVAWASHDATTVARVSRRLATLPRLSRDILVDDRHSLTIGKRLLQANKMGYPYVVVCGKASCENPPRYELHDVNAATMQLYTEPDLVEYFSNLKTYDFDDKELYCNELCV